MSKPGESSSSSSKQDLELRVRVSQSLHYHNNNNNNTSRMCFQIIKKFLISCITVNLFLDN